MTVVQLVNKTLMISAVLLEWSLSSIFSMYVCSFQPRVATGLLLDLAANEKSVHADFMNGKQVFILCPT